MSKRVSLYARGGSSSETNIQYWWKPNDNGNEDFMQNFIKGKVYLYGVYIHSSQVFTTNKYTSIDRSVELVKVSFI